MVENKAKLVDFSTEKLIQMIEKQGNALVIEDATAIFLRDIHGYYIRPFSTMWQVNKYKSTTTLEELMKTHNVIYDYQRNIICGPTI